MRFIERVPILGREERPLASPDGARTTLVNTYRLEELTATKLRALYGRRKGRDLYDLAQIGAFDLDERALRKLTLYYFYHARMIFHYAAFRANVEEKLRRRGFADDVRGLIRGDQQFDWQEASRLVLERFVFLEDLDERDRGFLHLARHLLGGPVSEHETETLAQIEHPIAWLKVTATLVPDILCAAPAWRGSPLHYDLSVFPPAPQLEIRLSAPARHWHVFFAQQLGVSWG